MSLDREEFLLYSQLNVFRKRVEQAERIIQEALALGKFYVACSFGKDSVVLAHMVIQQAPDIPVMFIDSQYCFEDTYKTRDEFIEKYNINLTVIKQNYDYLDIIEKYGIGVDRTDANKKKVVQLLKKDKGNSFAKDNDCLGCFWGLRKEEAKGRKMLLNCKGQLFHSKAANLWKCSPLANFTWEDVWAYIFSKEVPFSGIYLKTKFRRDIRQIRNSSYLTTLGANEGSIVWLKYYYPEKYKFIAEEFPEIRGYS